MRKDRITMTPSRFDVRANDVSGEGAAIIKPWKPFALDPDYAGAWIVAGDIDGDGHVEIVSAKNVDVDGVHYTSSVVPHRLDGSVFWRSGDPTEGRNLRLTATFDHAEKVSGTGGRPLRSIDAHGRHLRCPRHESFPRPSSHTNIPP